MRPSPPLDREHGRWTRCHRPNPTHGLRPEALGAAAVVVLFIAISTWWVLADHHLEGGDGSRHLWIALNVGDMIERGDLGSIVELGPDGPSFYPPLVHTIGGAVAAAGVRIEDGGVLALNVLFVPLLALGCYATGRLVYGRRAGLLAVVFALGTPMVISLFHDFLLDAPLAAVVAAAVWALLASERFARRRESVVAGALIGVALLIKPLAPLYFIAPIAVMVVAGGWRRATNLALALAAILVVAGPYYALHLGDVASLTGDATRAGGIGGTFGEVEFANPRTTPDALAWYGWIAVNNQFLLPLCLLLVAGVVLGIREVRERQHVPELLAGLIGGYLLLTLVPAIRDPRYTIPLLIFAAVLATGWIATSRRPGVRVAGIAVLATAAVLNTVAAMTTALPTLRIVPPDTEVGIIDRGSLTILDDRGYTVGPPKRDPFWDRLLEGAAGSGIETATIGFLENVPWGGGDYLGFAIAAREHGIEAANQPGTRPDLRVRTWIAPEPPPSPGPPPPEPCGSVREGVNAPRGSDPVTVEVAVERRLAASGRYTRWCEF